MSQTEHTLCAPWNWLITCNPSRQFDRHKGTLITGLRTGNTIQTCLHMLWCIYIYVYYTPRRWFWLYNWIALSIRLSVRSWSLVSCTVKQVWLFLFHIWHTSSLVWEGVLNVVLFDLNLELHSDLFIAAIWKKYCHAEHRVKLAL